MLIIIVDGAYTKYLASGQDCDTVTLLLASQDWQAVGYRTGKYIVLGKVYYIVL